MKAYLFGLFFATSCLLYGCHLKNRGQDATIAEKTDSLSTKQPDASLMTTHDLDTSSTLSVSTKDWEAKDIRDSIERFMKVERSTLPPHLQRIQKNINALWNTDSIIFLTLITTDTEHLQAFKKYVFDSPLIQIAGGSPKAPQGIILNDSSLFQMKVLPNVYPTSTHQIEITITNHSDREGMAGEDQFIEYFDGRQWIGLPQNNIFNLIGYPIAAGETRSGFIARLLPDLKKNAPGLYRVYKRVNIGKGKDLVEYILTAPFYLSDDPTVN